MPMNLYQVTLHDNAGFTGIYGETLHVQATTAGKAIEAAYKKFEKKYPDCGAMTCHSLKLVEEKW